MTELKTNAMRDQQNKIVKASMDHIGAFVCSILSMTMSVAFTVEKAFEIDEKSAVLGALKAACEDYRFARSIGGALCLMSAVKVNVIQNPSAHDYKCLGVENTFSALKVFYVSCAIVCAYKLAYTDEFFIFIA